MMPVLFPCPRYCPLKGRRVAEPALMPMESCQRSGGSGEGRRGRRRSTGQVETEGDRREAGSRHVAGP